MSTGIVSEGAETLPETIYVVTKKLGVDPRQQIALTTEEAARNWLHKKISQDRAMREFHWSEYKKLVAESERGEVYGTIETVPTTDPAP